MKNNLTLTITSLISIICGILHLTSDTLRAKAGTAEAGGTTLVLVPILVIWLYGTLVLREQRSGYLIMLIGSLLALATPILHIWGVQGLFTAPLVKSNGDFLFVLTLHAIAVSGMLSLILSTSGLWNLRLRNQS